MSDDELYRAYLERARRELGVSVVGSYGKYRGRLVKVLDGESFASRWAIYQQARDALADALERGDTVNDAVVRMIEEHGAELLLGPDLER